MLCVMKYICFVVVGHGGLARKHLRHRESADPDTGGVRHSNNTRKLGTGDWSSAPRGELPARNDAYPTGLKGV
jgi:hypothetical protein